MASSIVHNSTPPEKIFICRECDKGFIVVIHKKEKSVHICRLCRGHGKHEKLNDLQIRRAQCFNSMLKENPLRPVPYLVVPLYG